MCFKLYNFGVRSENGFVAKVFRNEYCRFRYRDGALEGFYGASKTMQYDVIW